jgi:hypothetical protein
MSNNSVYLPDLFIGGYNAYDDYHAQKPILGDTKKLLSNASDHIRSQHEMPYEIVEFFMEYNRHMVSKYAVFSEKEVMWSHGGLRNGKRATPMVVTLGGFVYKSGFQNLPFELELSDIFHEMFHMSEQFAFELSAVFDLHEDQGARVCTYVPLTPRLKQNTQTGEEIIQLNSLFGLALP